MSHFVVGAIRHALGSEDLGCMNELAKFIEYDVNRAELRVWPAQQICPAPEYVRQLMGFELFEKRGWREDADPSPFDESQQMLVAGANHLSSSLQGCFKDTIVVWICGDCRDALFRLNDGSQPRDLIDGSGYSVARPTELVSEDPCELGKKKVRRDEFDPAVHA